MPIYIAKISTKKLDYNNPGYLSHNKNKFKLIIDTLEVKDSIEVKYDLSEEISEDLEESPTKIKINNVNQEENLIEDFVVDSEVDLEEIT